MKNYLLLLSIFALAACGQNAPTNQAVNQTAKPSPSISANAAPNNTAVATVSPSAAPSVADKSKIKTFDGKGVVTRINLELVSVELDHEEIKGLMPKMTMEFYVKEKSELEKLNVGDKVDFVLEDNAGAEQIISIKKAK